MRVSRDIKDKIDVLDESASIAVVKNNELIKKLMKLYPKRNIYSVSEDTVVNYMTGHVKEDNIILFILSKGGTYLYEKR